jgi:hypothetical protein
MVIVGEESIACILESWKCILDPDSGKGRGIEAKIKEILILFGKQSFLG